jgi:ribosomal-protein-alanine N-acetyltransferase
LFASARQDPDAIIGSVNFNNFVRRAGQYCALGYGLDRDKEGQGLMTEALRAAIEYVFTTLNMHRIMANYMPWNERSGKVLAKLGFEKEGFARQFLYINGKWEDHIMTALVNEAWDPSRA